MFEFADRGLDIDLSHGFRRRMRLRASASVYIWPAATIVDGPTKLAPCANCFDDRCVRYASIFAPLPRIASVIFFHDRTIEPQIQCRHPHRYKTIGVGPKSDRWWRSALNPARSSTSPGTTMVISPNGPW
jgi:hypothetical protein